MLYFLYEIKNNINGKIYIGVHKTNNIYDGYMGSGKNIKRAIKKYGIENFTKTIIQYTETFEDALLLEKEYVNDDFLNRNDVYNLRRGGKGGFGKYHYELAKEVKQGKLEKRISEYNLSPNVCKNCGIFLEYKKRKNIFCSSSCSVTFNNYTRIRSEETNHKCSQTLLGRPKTDDHKKAISEGRKKGILDRVNSTTSTEILR